MRQADWAGRAIAPSSWGVPAMASLFTGLRPWQHQVLTARTAPRSPPTSSPCPRPSQARGYETAGFTGEATGTRGSSATARGSTAFEGLGQGAGARRSGSSRARRPAGSSSGSTSPSRRRPTSAAAIRRSIDAPGADAPKVLLPRIGTPAPALLRPRQPAAARAGGGAFWAMYRLNVGLGRRPAGPAARGAASRAASGTARSLVVTANHGEEFGEKGQILHGGNLGRQLLEVPLVVKLPQGFGRQIAEPKERRVAAARLWATLVEAAGGTAPPAVAPSLFRRGPAERPLGALPDQRHQPASRCVDGDDQLLWESRFAPPRAGPTTGRAWLMKRGNARLAPRRAHRVPPGRRLRTPARRVRGRAAAHRDGAPRLDAASAGTPKGEPAGRRSGAGAGDGAQLGAGPAPLRPATSSSLPRRGWSGLRRRRHHGARVNGMVY